MYFYVFKLIIIHSFVYKNVLAHKNTHQPKYFYSYIHFVFKCCLYICVCYILWSSTIVITFKDLKMQSGR